MPSDARFDQAQILPGPVDGSLEAILEWRRGLEVELALRLLDASEPPAGAIPVAGWKQLDAGRVVGQVVDQLCELADRGLFAARQVVDVSGQPPIGAGQQSFDEVADVDEVPRRAAFVFELERQAL